MRRLALLVFAGLCAGLVFAADLVRRFDLPADDAERALKRFSEQAGQQVLFPTSVVQGVRTNPVRGELETGVALERLLAGTGLTAVRDEQTGAFTVRRAPEPAAGQPVQRTEDGAVRMAAMEVSASRINGPVNQTIFDTNETGVYHYDVINRVEIDRLGVANMEELLRFVPQTSDYGAGGLQGQVAMPQSPGGGTYQNSEVKLRGFSSLQTSILINGRRLQRGNVSAGADLNRIPVAAIERIEILPSSASAVYGGGAIGGVINIILRKDYAGRDLTVNAGTSTDGGGTTYGFTYFEGRAFNDQRTRLSYTLDYSHSDALRLDDRDYLQRALDRYPASSALLVGGRPIYEQYIIPAFASNPGTIIVNSPTASLGIPGNPAARFAAIPPGLTAAQASALTPASFASAGNQANLGSRFGRSVLYRPEDRYSLNATIEHAFVPDKFELYAELGASYMRSEYSYPQITPTINLAANDLLNPFRTNVTPGFAGVPISIVLDPVDLPDPSLLQERRGARGVLGFKGKIGDRWEWSIDGTGEYGRSHSEGTNPTQNLVSFINSTASAGLTQAQRRAIYNPLADHIAHPSTVAMEPFIGYTRFFTFWSNLAQVNFRAVGDVLDLPAGPLTVSPGGEIIWAQFQTRQQVVTSAEYIASVSGSNPAAAYTSNSRRTESAFVEMSAPLIGEKWRPIPLHAVDLNAAARWEGTDDSTDKTTPTAGLRVAFTRDLAVRVSYAEGFFPPDQVHYEASRTTENAVTPGTDPFRGNTNIPPRTEISGGNPNLKPETSKSWNYGIVFTPRFAPGLTLTADYWRIEKRDAIRAINGPSFVVADPASYPGRVVRAERTPADIANGWLGAVTLIDWRPINVGFTATEGVDLRVRYTFDVAALGKFTSLTSATWTNSFRDQVFPANPIVERVGSSGNPLKWRGYTSLFWERGVWTAGLTARYVDDYAADTTLPSPVYPTALGFDGKRIPAATLFDLQLSYDIPLGRHEGLKGWLNGTQWTIKCENILNKEPEYRTDRYGFYSRYESPRQRYVTLRVKKSF